jgi:phosphoglycerate kinase
VEEMNLRHLDEFSFQGKRVILRSDLNVPIKAGEITDDGRILASLPTMNHLLNDGASIVLIAHLGRPKGDRIPELSLEPVAVRLSELLNRRVHFATDARQALQAAAALKSGEVLLIENIRYESAETSKEGMEREEFARQLSRYGEFYVGDGFGAVHRKHASVFELARMLPHAAGLLVQEEVRILESLSGDPTRPYAVVLGGAKVSEKIAVINNLMEKVDLLVIGGGMVFTFLAASGYEIGKSLLERDQIEMVHRILDRAMERGVEVLLPTDLLVATKFEDLPPKLVKVGDIASDEMGLDIGPESSHRYAEALAAAKTVFWNGPMGVFEFSHYQEGTRVIAETLTKIDGLTVVGGGDSAAAIRALGFRDDQFSYISTGGGASLEYLEGKELPGLAALQ